MAFDVATFVKKRTTALQETDGFNVNNFLLKRGITPKYDLTTSEGLYQLSQSKGGTVATAGQEIMQPDQSFLGKVRQGLKSGLGKTLDILQRPNFAVASAVKNVVDKTPETTFLGGLKTGITGQTRNTFSDVFEEAGWNPNTRLGKIAKGVTGFAADVLLDPTTYITFGAGAGIKVAGKTLSKTGTEFLAKALTKETAKAFGEDFVKNAVVNMAEKSPELYAKFLDKGGIKFFGNTLVSGGRIAGVVKSIPGMTKLDEVTQPVRNTLYALFNRDASAKFGKLPQEFADLKQKYLDLGKVKSADAVDQAINIAQANKITQTEAELITNAIESHTHLADDRLDNARKLFENVLGRNLKDELKRGIAVGELPNYVPHILVENPVKNIPFKPEGVRVNLGASKSRTIGKLMGTEFAQDVAIGKGKNIQQATIKEINEAFGKEFFDPNVIKAVANRSMASARATTASDFLRDTAAKFGEIPTKAPSGYIKTGAKELKDFVFHPQIAEQIDKFKSALINDEATNKLAMAFDKIQNLWKASVTSIFPAFHGRNALSNVFLNFLDIGGSALSPAKHALATHLQFLDGQAGKLEKAVLAIGEGAQKAKTQLSELLNQKMLTDVSGKAWTFGELRKVIKENRIAFSGDFLGFLDIPETVSKKLGQVSTVGAKGKQLLQAVNPFSQENIAFRAGRKVGNTIEQQARILNFVTNLQKTGDVMNSAKRTKQFLFDYQNLSGFEKTFMRRLIPFYTFTRKNLELQVGQFLKQPGKFATQAKLITTTSNLIGGSTLTEDEKNLLPQFLKEGLGIVVKREGSKLEMISNLGLPIEQVFQNLKPNAILGSMSPILAVPLQVAIGKHFFFDKDLKDVNDAIAYKNAPQFLKDYIGFTVRKNKDGTDRYIALNPTRLFILNNIPPSSRVVQTIGQLEAENVSGKLKILRQLTGLKPYGTDLEMQALYQEKQKIRDLQDLLEKAGVAPIMKRSFIPKVKSKYVK